MASRIVTDRSNTASDLRSTFSFYVECGVVVSFKKSYAVGKMKK